MTTSTNIDAAGVAPDVGLGDMVRAARLMQFADSTLPVGAFAFSNGLESAIQTGVVSDRSSLRDYVELVVRQAARMDGIALLHALRAARAQDIEALKAADQALWSRRVGQEQQLMLARMGKKLAELSLKIGDFPLAQIWLTAIKAEQTPGCFPVTQAIVLAQLQATDQEAFVLHQYGVASMVLSAAVRLMRIDHFETQSVLFEIQQRVGEDYAAVRDMELDDMSVFAPVFDVLVAHHTKTHVRLFMN
ncbi:urease accessory protein UreF [Lampropedia aestuarii]|nr:urease accessory UreF family protein [Lampropedia aestuarii]